MSYSDKHISYAGMGDQTPDAPPSPLGVGEYFEFHYQKVPQYRSVHVDGFWGGATPRGQFAVSFFSERLPIPRHARRQIVSSSESQFVAGPEEITESLSGVVRQIENTVFMDVKTAQEFYEWFGQHLRNLERTIGVPDAERVTKDEDHDVS